VEAGRRFALATLPPRRARLQGGIVERAPAPAPLVQRPSSSAPRPAPAPGPAWGAAAPGRACARCLPSLPPLPLRLLVLRCHIRLPCPDDRARERPPLGLCLGLHRLDHCLGEHDGDLAVLVCSRIPTSRLPSARPRGTG